MVRAINLEPTPTLIDSWARSSVPIKRPNQMQLPSQTSNSTLSLTSSFASTKYIKPIVPLKPPNMPKRPPKPKYTAVAAEPVTQNVSQNIREENKKMISKIKAMNKDGKPTDYAFDPDGRVILKSDFAPPNAHIKSNIAIKAIEPPLDTETIILKKQGAPSRTYESVEPPILFVSGELMTPEHFQHEFNLFEDAVRNSRPNTQQGPQEEGVRITKIKSLF